MCFADLFLANGAYRCGTILIIEDSITSETEQMTAVEALERYGDNEVEMFIGNSVVLEI